MRQPGAFPGEPFDGSGDGGVIPREAGDTMEREERDLVSRKEPLNEGASTIKTSRRMLQVAVVQHEEEFSR
jgi:hypothetical protein